MGLYFVQCTYFDQRPPARELWHKKMKIPATMVQPKKKRKNIKIDKEETPFLLETTLTAVSYGIKKLNPATMVQQKKKKKK